MILLQIIKPEYKNNHFPLGYKRKGTEQYTQTRW